MDDKGRFSVPSVYRDIMKRDAYYLLNSYLESIPYLDVISQTKLSAFSDDFLKNVAHQIGNPIETDTSGRSTLLKEQRKHLQTPNGKTSVVTFGLWNTFGICAEDKWPHIEAILLKRKNAAPLTRLSSHPK